MSTPRKAPVAPWIPPQQPRPDPAATRRVRRATGGDWRSPLKAGWYVNWALLICGLVLAGALLLADDSRGASGSLRNAVAMVISVLAGGAGLLLLSVADIIVLVMAIIVMARGAPGRGLWLIAGSFIMAGLGMLAVMGVLELKELRARDAQAADAVPATKATHLSLPR